MSWPLVNLGEVCEFKYGKGLAAGQRDGGKYAVYGSNGIVGAHSKAVTTGATVVIGRKGSFGEVAYSADACWPIDTTYYVDATTTQADLKWLSYRLRSLGLTGLNRASAVPGLNREDAYRQTLLLPPLDEQRRIAAILDHADALRAKGRRVRTKFDELVQSIFLDMFGDHAELRPISQLCELLVDCVNRTAPTVPGPTPYKMLRTTNVRNGRVDTENVRFVSKEVIDRWNRRATPQRGDVILTREAPVGEAGVLESDDQVFLGQRLFLYRTDPTKMTPEFLLACFRSPILQAQFDRLGSGSTVKHLPLPACQSFMIPAPPIEDQQEYSARVSVIRKSAKLMQETEALEADLFGVLQTRAFSGQL